MIKILKKEWYHRAIIIILFIIIITITTILYSNDIILWMLNPIKEINNDFHNKVTYNMINKAYNAFDSEKKISSIINKKIDYMPSYEISIKMEQIWKITAKIILNINIILCMILVYKQIIIMSLPSIYKYEKNIIIKKYILDIYIVIISIIMTQKIWTQIYWQISLHNYYEYNYYEIDIMFDINSYINNYIKIIYITIWTIKIKKNFIIICITLWAIKILNSIEMLYIYCIWEIKNKIKMEINKIKKIKHNMLEN